MKIAINSIGFDADKKLIEFINKKVGKLATFYEKIIDSEVFLSLDNNTTGKNKISKIKIDIPGETLFAEKEAISFEEATDLSVEALRRQLKKHKEKERE
jgi:putative sigma-54 modulation protein